MGSQPLGHPGRVDGGPRTSPEVRRQDRLAPTWAAEARIWAKTAPTERVSRECRVRGCWAAPWRHVSCQSHGAHFGAESSTASGPDYARSPTKPKIDLLHKLTKPTPRRFNTSLCASGKRVDRVCSSRASSMSVSLAAHLLRISPPKLPLLCACHAQLAQPAGRSVAAFAGGGRCGAAQRCPPPA